MDWGNGSTTLYIYLKIIELYTQREWVYKRIL